MHTDAYVVKSGQSDCAATRKGDAAKRLAQSSSTLLSQRMFKSGPETESRPIHPTASLIASLTAVTKAGSMTGARTSADDRGKGQRRHGAIASALPLLRRASDDPHGISGSKTETYRRSALRCGQRVCAWYVLLKYVWADGGG